MLPLAGESISLQLPGKARQDTILASKSPWRRYLNTFQPGTKHMQQQPQKRKSVIHSFIQSFEMKGGGEIKYEEELGDGERMMGEIHGGHLFTTEEVV